ncbi:MAG: hypothetical protein KIT09_06780 [Bryobacteraceae bacterium]|nr:hypothetical protein [Bryobacteraceae bacterium]
MRRHPAVDYQFQNKGKFALLTFSVYVDLPSAAFRMSDGTWVMPGVPVPDLGVWKEWIGSIRLARLEKANLVLFAEEPSGDPEILDAVHQRLGNELSQLFCMAHLRSGIECESADLLCGSSEQGVPGIRQVRQLPTFYQSNGYSRSPITKEWLEETLTLRAGVMAMEADKTQFRRVIRGLNTLFKGLRETGQDRLHQFVRSLEALIVPDIGQTQTQFAHRCQTFARAGDDTRTLLLEAFKMRSDTEHLHPWDKTVQNYPPDQREDVCWRRTRQIEHLACDAYSRLLRDASIRRHFQTDATIAAFWKLPDDQRRAQWGKPLDIAREPLIHLYDQWGRAAT